MPATYPLDLYRPDAYRWIFTLWTDAAKTIPMDLSGATAKAQIRDRPGGSRVIDMPCHIGGNSVDMNLPTPAWGTFEAPTAVWDLRLSFAEDGASLTVLTGPVTITSGVTDSAPVPICVPASGLP